MFEKLTPSDKVDMKGYEEAFNFVFTESDIRNIAISGAYSSGKSSVLESYERNHPKKKFLHLSLAHFDQSKGEDESVDDQSGVQEKQIEGKILNQLIQQIPAEKIPQTSFRVKRKVNEHRIKVLTIGIAMLLALIVYFAKVGSWKSFAMTTDDFFLRNIAAVITSSYAKLLCGGIFIAITVCFLYKLIGTQYKKNIFRKISVQGNEIEIFSDESDSFFDKYLNEVLYLFERVDVDGIVFEDIDRFDNLMIFERLREINTLANARMKSAVRKKRPSKRKNRIGKACADNKRNGSPKNVLDDEGEGYKPLRFFYLLRDDIFVNKDRTKFFDYIIPVVPVIDSSNSYNKLRELIDQTEAKDLFDDYFLRGVSLYIDDLRLLKNIYNEFLIYNTKLNTIELNANKLLAILIYKNLFPYDFAQLQLNRGFVYSLFHDRESYVAERQKILNKKCNEINERIEYCKKEHLQTLEELEIIKRNKDKGNSYSQEGRAYKEWMEKEYPKRKQAIEDRNNNALDQLYEEIREIEKAKNELSNARLEKILNRDIIDDVFQGKYTNGREIEENNAIRSNPYFDLLKYLLSHGYIDETYFDYMGYFYSNSLTLNDKMFLRSVTDRKAKLYNYPINSPMLVSESLSDFDFTQAEILNYDLMDYVLRGSNTIRINNMITQLRNKNRLDYIEGYISCGKEMKLFALSLNREWPEFIEVMISDGAISISNMKKYSWATLETCDEDVLNKVNISEVLTHYISSDPDYLSVRTSEVNAFNNALSILKVQFEQINEDGANEDIFEYVYNHSLYRINEANISLMLESKCKVESFEKLYSRFIEFIASNPEEPLCRYLWDNIEDTFDVYFESYEGSINDSLTTVISVLNREDLEREKKEIYVEQLTTLINDISNIEKEEDQRIAIDHLRVEYTEQNILFYYSKHGLSNELIYFINSDETTLNYLSTQDENASKFWHECLTMDSLDDDKYRQIAANLSECFQELTEKNISANHFLILIELGKIEMNAANLNFVRLNYKEQVYAFIKGNFEEYCQLCKNELMIDELKEILEWRNIADKNKIELLTLTNLPVSLINHNYSSKVMQHILRNNFDNHDIPWLIEHYEKMAGETKECVYSVLKRNIDRLLDSGNDIEKKLRERLFLDDEIGCEHKFQLLQLTAIKMSYEELYEILISLGGEKIVFDIRDGQYSRVEVNENNEALLKSLFDSGVIQEPEIDKAGRYYKKIKLKNVRSSNSMPRALL